METSGTSDSWDYSKSPAEIHEQYLVPAVYAQVAIQLTHVAEIDSGFKVLDVGCGTGILARKAFEEVGFTGKVYGLDLDESMLAVASKAAPQVEWRQGDAADLPFEAETFDRVVSQFMLPAVKNRVGVTREMWRVLKPGGKLILAVWAALHQSPAFNILVRLTQEHAGFRAGAALSLPWELGFENKLSAILQSAGIKDATINHQKATARFPSPATVVESWVAHNPAVSSLIKERQYQRIYHAACDELEQYRVSTGGLVCSMDALVITARKP